MLSKKDYYEEIDEDNRDFAKLNAEYMFALCCAMVYGQRSN